jgi:hypothetical protein
MWVAATCWIQVKALGLTFPPKKALSLLLLQLLAMRASGIGLLVVMDFT